MSQHQEKNKKKWKNNGDSWYFSCYYIDIYGNRKRHKSGLYKNKKIAKEEERKFLNKVEIDLYHLILHLKN